ncbi:hypothetical protein D3C80_1498690 [compost metagenome]
MHQPAGVEQVDAPTAIRARPQQVFKLQCRLAKQRLGALLFQGRQPPQQGLGGGRGHQCTVFTQQLRVVLQVRQQRLEVLEVQQ